MNTPSDSEICPKFNDPTLGEFNSISKSTITMSALKIGLKFLKATARAMAKTYASFLL